MMAEAEKRAWLDASWSEGLANPQTLAAARASATAYLSMLEATWSDYNGFIAGNSPGAGSTGSRPGQT